MTDIGVRLREFSKRTKINLTAIAAESGISREILYKWKKGTKPRNIDGYFKLMGYLDRMEIALGLARLNKEDQKPATLRLPFQANKPAVPQTVGQAVAGTVIFTDNEPELIVYRISAPFLGVFDGAIEVTGDSMEPTFPNGCRVTITRLNDIRNLSSGKHYFVIDKNWQGIVRRVYQDNKANIIRLVSDNSDQLKYPPIEKSMDQIEGIFKVGASITKF